jgi:hypothetical protein
MRRTHTSPLVRFLLNPHRPLAPLTHAFEAADRVLEHVLRYAPLSLGVLFGLFLVGVLLARMGGGGTVGGRLVTLAVPPEVEPKAAQLLWAGLHDLLRPKWRRRLRGQPQLAWEITAGRAGTTFRLWIPSDVPRPGQAPQPPPHRSQPTTRRSTRAGASQRQNSCSQGVTGSLSADKTTPTRSAW